MKKEEIINYLLEKQKLTVEVQNAQHALSVVQNSYEQLKRNYKNYFLLTGFAFVVYLVQFVRDVNFFVANSYLLSILFTFIVPEVLIVLRIIKGFKAKSAIQAAEEKLNYEKSQPAYLAGMDGFPNKFYAYWTINRLIDLVKDGRTLTLQETYNLAEQQDFQNDNMAIQQRNLAVSEEALAVAKQNRNVNTVSAISNLGTFLNTRKWR